MLQLHHRASKSRHRTSTLSTDVPEACIITLSYNTARDYPSTDKSESIYSAGKYISKRKAMCEMLEGRINSQPHRKYAGKYHYLKNMNDQWNEENIYYLHLKYSRRQRQRGRRGPGPGARVATWTRFL